MFPAEQLPPAALKAWRAVLPRGDAGVRGRRHAARQHGAVLGRGRRRLRHRLEPVPARVRRRRSARGGRCLRRGLSRAAARARPAFAAQCNERASAHPACDRRARRGDDRVQPGARATTRRYLQGFGGDTSNMAIAAARSARARGYVTRVGDDAFGRLLLASVAATKASTRAAWRSTPPRRPASISSRTVPRGHEFCYLRAGSAASAHAPATLPLPIIRGARCCTFRHQPGDQRQRLRRRVRGDRRGDARPARASPTTPTCGSSCGRCRGRAP